MSFEGTVVNGTIVLDQPQSLPEGTRVEVMVKPAGQAARPTLHAILEMAGTLDDLPPDFAAEHDHYIHGTPRRKPKES